MARTVDVIYADCMGDIRQRLDAIKWTVAGNRVARSEFFFTTELIFIQFRKVLELIAFASLTINKDKYSAAHTNFSAHWRAKDMLAELAKVNPGFYPVPLLGPVTNADGTKHFGQLADGFLTREDFVKLYNSCGAILHTRNPFALKDPVNEIGYSVDEWVERIQNLLRWHTVELEGGKRWVANVPDTGTAQVFLAQAT